MTVHLFNNIVSLNARRDRALQTNGAAAPAKKNAVEKTTLNSPVSGSATSRETSSAFQNRVARTITSLGVNVENLTNQESPVTNADTAEEIALLTREQILGQPSTATMAQANLNPQSVLRLLT